MEHLWKTSKLRGEKFYIGVLCYSNQFLMPFLDKVLKNVFRKAIYLRDSGVGEKKNIEQTVHILRLEQLVAISKCLPLIHFLSS